jgi:hypothetical protein
VNNQIPIFDTITIIEEMDRNTTYDLNCFKNNVVDGPVPKFTRVGGVVVQTNGVLGQDKIETAPDFGVRLLNLVAGGAKAASAQPSPAPTADLFDLGTLTNYVNAAAGLWNICIGRGALSKLVHLFDPNNFDKDQNITFQIDKGFCLQIRKRCTGVESFQIVFEDTEKWTQEPSFGHGIESLLTTRNPLFHAEHGRLPWQYQYCTVQADTQTVVIRHEIDCFHSGSPAEIKSYNNRFFADEFHHALCVFLGCTAILVSVGRSRSGVIDAPILRTREDLMATHGQRFLSQLSKALQLLLSVANDFRNISGKKSEGYIIYRPGMSRTKVTMSG